MKGQYKQPCDICGKPGAKARCNMCCRIIKSKNKLAMCHCGAVYRQNAKKYKECGKCRFTAGHAVLHKRRALDSVNRRTRTCRGCGMEFVARSTKRMTYCTRECAADNRPYGAPCAVCGAARKGKCICAPLVVPRDIDCIECGIVIPFPHAQQLRCSYCNSKGASGSVRCEGCGDMMPSGVSTDRRKCDECVRITMRKQRSAARHKRRAREGSGVAGISWHTVAEVMGLACHWCGEQCDTTAHHNDDSYPSLEHVIPLASGGTHTWDNVAIAHRGCNHSSERMRALRRVC